ncbi:MAG TPA: HU family DNA-binding protein [Nitrospinota bacterium]|nr:HU family DNA-binding protein [Nitrospinota bacterium]
MTKAELVAQIAKDAKITKVAANAAVDSVVKSITKSLKKGQNVTLVGFGTFTVGKRKARTGRNPQTGAKIKIAARKVPKFRAGKGLKATIK